MCQLQQGAKEGGEQKRRARKDVINYHGPYVDSSGEKFYLPRKWTLCPTTDRKTTQRRYKECGINYSFKPDEMKGSDLMRNLQWLGQFGGHLRTLLDDDDEVNDNNDEDAEEQSDLMVVVGHRGNAVTTLHTSLKKKETSNVPCPKWRAR